MAIARQCGPVQKRRSGALRAGLSRAGHDSPCDLSAYSTNAIRFFRTSSWRVGPAKTDDSRSTRYSDLVYRVRW
jgi:hypothetical protein